jgi:hypothetical protein
MKFCVFIIFQLLPWIAWVGDWALRWTEGNEAIQITFVMFVFPLIMNAIQYWIIDGFIKEQDGAGEGDAHYEGVQSDEEDEDSEDERWLEGRRGGRGAGRGSEDDEDSDVDVEARAGIQDTLKEANPTAVPVRQGGGKGKMKGREREYDPEVDGQGSGGDGKDR